MPVYAYSALDSVNAEAAGTLAADTPLEARRQLRERGLRIVAFRAAEAQRSRTWQRRPGQRRRAEAAAEVARFLSLLLRAGVPLSESLEVLSRRGGGSLTLVLKELGERIAAGAALAEALAAHPTWFDALFVSAVRVGELSGNLDEALAELADHLQNREKLRGQLTAALAYPMILVAVAVLVVGFLMSYVIPQLLTVLTAAGRPLPASTLLLKSCSDLLIHRWPVLIITVVGLIAAVTFALRTTTGRRAWHRFQLRVPILGALLQKNLIAQFAQRMALLLRTGVPFVEALHAVAELSRQRVLVDELRQMAAAVESGSDIAPAMKESRIFPPVVVHLVAVGQESGELTALLSELRTRYETEVRLALAKFTAALEPLLIVLLAVGVGFVVFACLMPILEATRGIA